MSKIRKNWIFIIVTTMVLTGVYLQYKRSIFTYICENERNAPGCYLLYLEYKDSDKTKSQRFLETSCGLKYELACKEVQKRRDAAK